MSGRWTGTKSHRVCRSTGLTSRHSYWSPTYVAALPHARWPVLPGQAILQPGVAELVDRTDCAQDIAVAGIFEEAHKAYGSPLANGKLNKCKARRPGHRVHETACRPKREPNRDTGREPCGEADPAAAHETDHESEGKPEAKPDRKPGHETDRPDGHTRKREPDSEASG